MDHYERFGVLPPSLVELLPTVSKLSDQGVLVAYWLTHPSNVRVDVEGALFATLKRFFVLSGDDRGRRGRNASRPHHKAPRQVSCCVESTSELDYPEKYCVDLREPPRHRADAATGITSRRWRGAPEI